MQLLNQYDTPNPNAIKFVINDLSNKLAFEVSKYDNREFIPKSSVIHALFELTELERVFFCHNFIVIIKNPSIDWATIQSQIVAILSNKQYSLDISFSENLLSVPRGTLSESEILDPIIIKIKEILDQYIQPAIQEDGGFITFQSYINGTLRIKMHGACLECPSSEDTLQFAVKNLICNKIPEVKNVEMDI